MAKILTEQDVLNRFWNNIDIPVEHHTGDFKGCWIWNKCKNLYGYGWFYHHRCVSAHRWSYANFNGPLHPKLVVMHTCDNPTCCNPAHLKLGTIGDNNRDMYAKGRARGGNTPQSVPRGVKQKNAKLNDDKVRAIRGSTLPHSELAKMYGVSLGLISHVKSRRTWKHVP